MSRPAAGHEDGMRGAAADRNTTRPGHDMADLAVSVLAVILALILLALLAINDRTQVRIAQNGQAMAKQAELAKVDRALVQLLARSAFDNHDAAITALLARNGVTFRERPGTASAPAPAIAATAAGGR